MKSAKLSFIVDLSPLATDNYTVRYDAKPVAPAKLATDLTVTPGMQQVEITTRQFGIRLLQGEKKYRAVCHDILDFSARVLASVDSQAR